jgi:two-component sensor histidine kinase
MNSAAVAQPDAQLAARDAGRRFLDTLTALQGFLQTIFGDFADPAVRAAVAVFSTRIQASTGMHGMLADDAGETWVDASAHLGELCAELCAAQLAPRGLRCEFRSDPAILPRETCRKLGLIVVELVANAARHAFADRAYGRVVICLRRTERGWICQVADNGSGFAGGETGHGTKLVQGLAQALGGELRVHSDAGGVVVTLSLPDPPRPADMQADTATVRCHA